MRSLVDVAGIGMVMAGILVAVAGCGSSIPEATVTSLDQVAGTWEGTVSGFASSVRIRNMVIKPDGTWELEVIGGDPPKHRGRMQVVGGKLLSRSETTETSSTVTLYEGDGRRMLKSVSEDGRFTVELTPAKS